MALRHCGSCITRPLACGGERPTIRRYFNDVPFQQEKFQERQNPGLRCAYTAGALGMLNATVTGGIAVYRSTDLPGSPIFHTELCAHLIYKRVLFWVLSGQGPP